MVSAENEAASPWEPLHLSGPESVRVVVAGGPGAWIGLILGVGRWVTRPITLPANLDRLINKCADHVPNYLRY